MPQEFRHPPARRAAQLRGNQSGHQTYRPAFVSREISQIFLPGKSLVYRRGFSIEANVSNR